MDLLLPPYLDPSARASRARGPRASRRAHDWVDERSRALHATTAERLWRDPSLVRVAVAYLDRFEPGADPGSRPVLARWRRLIVKLPREALLALLVSPSEEASELRQSSPFLGILAPDERDAIFAHFETL